MLLTPSQDRARMISIIQNIELPNEEIDFCNGLQIAQLALKHRQNKNQRQRIIVFVGIYCFKFN
jgi:26S proteasome regulatory subunit N10